MGLVDYTWAEDSAQRTRNKQGSLLQTLTDGPKEDTQRFKGSAVENMLGDFHVVLSRLRNMLPC